MKIEQIYLAGKVVRYHTDPWFSQYHQTDADHTWGMLALLFYFNSNPSTNLVKSITYHDVGEYLAGDVPYPFKLRSPDVAGKHATVEKEIREEMLGEKIDLTIEEIVWQRFLDRVEAQCFMLTYRPELFDRVDWRENYKVGLDTAEQLGVVDRYVDFINSMKKAKQEKWG